jgi:hypothetical protein
MQTNPILLINKVQWNVQCEEMEKKLVKVTGLRQCFFSKNTMNIALEPKKMPRNTNTKPHKMAF